MQSLASFRDLESVNTKLPHGCPTGLTAADYRHGHRFSLEVRE
jgi:hypothetical protein